MAGIASALLEFAESLVRDLSCDERFVSTPILCEFLRRDHRDLIQENLQHAM